MNVPVTEDEQSFSKSARGWIFTLNNYSDDDISRFKAFVCDYLCFGKEVSSTGTPHLQGYLYVKGKVQFDRLKKLFPRAHWKIAAIDHRLALQEAIAKQQAQNMLYCSKEGEFYEHGRRLEPGTRPDINKVKESLKHCMKMREIVQEASSFQAMRMAEIRMSYIEPSRSAKPYVLWIHGDTYDECDVKQYFSKEADVYYQSQPTLGSWPGYDGHDVVVIRDFDESVTTARMLKKLFSEEPMYVNNKGGQRQFLAKCIIVTSPQHPILYYGNEKSYRVPIDKYIDKIINFDKELKDFF